MLHSFSLSMSTAEEKNGTGGRSKCGSIMVQPYPSTSEWSLYHHSESETMMELLQEIVRSARAVRSSLGLTNKRIDLYLLCDDQTLTDKLNRYSHDIATLAVANQVTAITESRDGTHTALIPIGCTSAIINPHIQVFIPLKGLVDFSSELIKMEKQTAYLTATINEMTNKMKANGYEKTKPEIQERNKDKLQNDQMELSKLNESISAFKSYMTNEELSLYAKNKLSSQQADAEKMKAAIEKILGKDADPSKLSKKLFSKYEEMQNEYQTLLKEIEAVTSKEKTNGA